MLLAALADTGLGEEPLRAAKLACSSAGVKASVKLTEVRRRGVRASRLLVEAEDRRLSVEEIKRAVERGLNKAGCSGRAIEYAMEALSILVEAEAEVHGVDPSEVHLHEAASPDTVVDLAGVAAALDSLKAFSSRVYCSPIALGGGLFTFSHGTFSAPAPATLEILRRAGLPSAGGPAGGELTTPTGAALLAALRPEPASFQPEMRVEAVGYGAGARDHPEVANVLRVVVGELTPMLVRDQVAVIEANLDDVTGELMSHAIERIMELGAKDVIALYGCGKKGRPAMLLKALAAPEDAERIAMAVIEETGTLGVRVYTSSRRVLQRELVEAEVEGERIRVKVARDLSGRVLRAKPEFDDLKRVSRSAGKPLRVVMKKAMAKAGELEQ